MHRVEFAPTPIQTEQCLLVFGRKLGAVSEGHPGGRSRTNVHHGPEAVRIPVRPFSGPVSPAKFAPAEHMANPCGAIPGSVEVVLHVRVVGEQFTLPVERGVKNVPVTGRENLAFLGVRRDPVDDPARGECVPHESAAIRHPGQQMILAPVQRNLRAREIGRFGGIAGDQIKPLAVRRRKQGMDSVIAPGFECEEVLGFVRQIVSIGVGDSVDPARHLLVVVVHRHIEGVKGPDHSVHRGDRGRNFLDLGGIQRLSWGRCLKPVKPSVLVTGQDASLRVGAEVDP